VTRQLVCWEQKKGPLLPGPIFFRLRLHSNRLVTLWQFFGTAWKCGRVEFIDRLFKFSPARCFLHTVPVSPKRNLRERQNTPGDSSC
jgi:hypothetical protein